MAVNGIYTTDPVESKKQLPAGPASSFMFERRDVIKLSLGGLAAWTDLLFDPAHFNAREADPSPPPPPPTTNSLMFERRDVIKLSLGGLAAWIDLLF